MTPRRPLLPRLFLLFVLLVIGLPVYAQGEIVYSARYYTPPGDKRTSSFHLYSINPDGTGRRQITLGTQDDLRPKWSPDGKKVLFERTMPREPFLSSLCAVGGNGGPVTTLIPDTRKVGVDKKVWLPDSRRVVLLRIDLERIADAASVEIWDTTTRKRTARYEACDDFVLSPDRQTLFLAKTGSGVFVDLKTGKQTPVQMSFSPSLWIDPDTQVSLESAPQGEEDTSFYGVKDVVLSGRDGKETRRFTPKLAPGITVGEDDVPVSVIQVAPGSLTSPGTIVLYAEHRSIYWFGILRLSDGTVVPRIGYTHPIWSPDGKRFVSLASEELTPYGKTGKRLYTAALCIGNDITQKPKPIVSGMVLVAGADWRGSRQ